MLEYPQTQNYLFFKHMEAQNVEIIVLCDKTGLKPQILRLGGYEYRLQKVNLHYISREGGRIVHYFACSDQANYFHLRFDPYDLTWQVLEIKEYG